MSLMVFGILFVVFILTTVLLATLGGLHASRCKTEADREQNRRYLFLFDLYGMGGLGFLVVAGLFVRIP